ncbi:MAG: phosphoribosylaminoimidazolesuccinocarboxamide synthase [Endomicrobiales bacterium]|nr:phosphoribosylaminoimidazolesuccinocarboxamide synthase [Endomicrobiales bacterium]
MNKQSVRYTRLHDVDFFKRGKVREIYFSDDNYLMVATDRISCFDVVLPTDIPDKGKVLTNLSLFWFKILEDIIGNHLITADTAKMPQNLHKYKDVLDGRSMLVKKAKPLPVECIVRGYLSGSGWKEYIKSESVCGIKLPSGLKESDKLPEPIFTPSTKAESGHDINVAQDYVEKEIGKELADKIKKLSLDIYKKASGYADSKGIILADTKFEFGFCGDELIIIDEVLTPDSSRFWPKDEYVPGKSQPSFDKQFVRDYLETLDWDKTPPGPELPDDIVNKTSEKYLYAYKILTGKELGV